MQALMNRPTVARGHRQSQTAKTTLLRCERPSAADKSRVVGLPEVQVGSDSVSYKDAQVTSTTKEMAVGNVTSNTAVGQGIGMQEEMMRVPRTEMRTEYVEVPEVRMEKQMVEMPETVTVQKEVEVQDVEMRTETITKEVVVLDEVIEMHPTTELKTIAIEKPVYTELPITIAKPTEVLRPLTVRRPEDVMERVSSMRPVERKRMITVSRPYQVKRMVTVERPRQIVDTVNVDHPEIEASTVGIKVPVSEQRVVQFADAVTRIRPTGDEAVELQAAKADTAAPRAAALDDDDLMVARDWTKIPVGLPFTEVHKRTETYNITQLKDDVADVRQTVMKPVPVEMKGYVMESVEVEVTETEMRDEEMEVVEWVLEPFEMDVEVTTMREVEEQWPYSESVSEEVTTSDVVLTPTTAVMPQLAMKEVTVEVPRTEIYEKDIQKAVPITRTEIVDELVTEMRQVEVERPVEYMKTVEVQKPVTVYDDVSVVNPISQDRELTVQEVVDRKAVVREENAEYSTKSQGYKVADTRIKPTDLGKEYEVDPATQKVNVTEEQLRNAKRANVLPTAAGTIKAEDLVDDEEVGTDGKSKKKGFFGIF